MADMGAIAGALASIKAAVDITKAMKDLRDWSVVQSKVIELQSTILEAQGSLFSANEERAALIEKVRDAERKIASLEAWQTEKERYQLTDIGQGTFAYALKQSMSQGEPAHYVCTNCYQQSKKSVLNHMQSPGGMHVITCPSCDAKMGIRHGYIPPSYVMTEQDLIRAALEPCSICATGRLKITHVGPHPEMGEVGLQERTLACDNLDCKHTEKRMHDPMGLMANRR